MIAVIGAGASGVLTAVHVVRRSATAKIALLDAGARAARGLAYGTPYGAHLLNVPAARMSALADEPDHFVRWLQGKLPDATPATFAPRPLYGDYLASVLAAHESPQLSRISGSAVGLTRDSEGQWSVHLHDGRIVHADTVVLALGNLPPADPFPQETQALNYVRDPWAPGAGQGLAADAPVLLVGSGLTMIDIALALRHEGHRGALHVISRHGLLPRSHATYTPMHFERLSGSPRALFRSIRRAIERANDWRAVIDALRPHTHSIWQSWTLEQRGSFLRHARTMWDVHRHRSAPSVAAEVDQLLREGALVVHRGRIRSLSDTTDGILARWSSAGEPHELRVARVINCTGPASNYANVDLPLVLNMRRAGWLVPDPLGLGIESSADGRIVGSDGRPVDGLFTIGPLRRPALWESTAIPEIRAQADALAAVLGTQ